MWGSSQEVSRRHRSPWWPPGRFWQRQWERYVSVGQMTWTHRARSVESDMKRGDFNNDGLRLDFISRIYCLFLSFTWLGSRFCLWSADSPREPDRWFRSSGRQGWSWSVQPRSSVPKELSKARTVFSDLIWYIISRLFFHISGSYLWFHQPSLALV